jgi:hypothetical protein
MAPDPEAMAPDPEAEELPLCGNSSGSFAQSAKLQLK